MFRCRFQDRAHVAALRVGWTKAVWSVGENDVPVAAKINDDFDFTGKSVDMARFMVLRVGNEQDVIEPQRCHAFQYNLSSLGYQRSSFLC